MRNRFLLAVAVILALLPGNLAWSQANLPNNANAVTVQGPDPTGMLGYPLATVPATGALPWPVAIQSFAASLCVTQCTSPWIVAGQNTVTSAFANPANAIPSQSFPMVWNGATWDRLIEIPPSGGNIPAAGIPAAGMMIQNGGLGGSFYNVISSNNVDSTQGAQIVASGMSIRGNLSNLFYSVRNAQSDAGLDGSLQSTPMLFDGTFLRRQRVPDHFLTVTTAAAGNAALWTPAAGKKFRLMRYLVTVTDQATQAGAGTLTFSLFDGAAGVTGQVHDVFVPALGLVNTGSLYSSGWIDLGNGYLSTAANNVLNINLSAALTAGTVRVICCGTEE